MKYRIHDSSNASDAPDIQRRQLLLAALGAGCTSMVATGLWLRPAGAAKAAAGAKRVRIVFFDNSGQRLDERLVPKVVKTQAEWQQLLAPLSYQVTRENGTERAFSGHHLKPDRPGIYRCICCATALYDAATQFHSGTGWPSFWQPIAQANVRERVDTSLWMRRTEIECTRCNAHLGHVFNDGPPPTGLRYCMNAVAMNFAAANGDPIAF